MTSPTVSEKYSSPWSPISIPNAPFTFVPATDSLVDTFGIDMSLAHNVIIRSLNSLWVNAPLVSPSSRDLPAYIGYGSLLLHLIHTHHHGEEAVFFPLLGKKIDMGVNVNQHEAFQGQMERLEAYLGCLQKKEEVYDSEKMRRLVKEFADPLVEHLTEEIETISPERLSAFTEDELAAILLALENYVKGLGGFTTLFPFALTHNSKHDSPNWPVVPGPIKWFANNIGYWFYRSYWKFSPYTRSGEPQVYQSEAA